ncbi:FKBP-type peptidyl-prolyl cis-trans isomerase [Hymenobacter arizonensis]|uniref:Peptidyl-prolyl cis-trans isomerase n=1 Tax=Hymenobacter arizonensis TaxID=1227077 RepID=A0A1I5ZIX8_HYMAR|nr:FKBP-type peptidyl-prolyl cis-trans isomerase [Hymenobacter arizonensis]SFQ56323.1 FKBP-type peptidyl-prolyl cis-trans isomerase [Hymenobacter arizonensis]
MKNLLLRSRYLVLALGLLLAAPALWSCNTETTFQKTLREHEEKMKRIDEDTIRNFLTKNRLISKARQTESGLYVVDSVAGQGTQVTAGKQVTVRYIGRFLSNGAQPGSTGYPASFGNQQFPAGSIFDNSSENRTGCGCAVLTSGTNSMFGAGFAEGLLLMRKGDRKLLLVPSRLAFGANPSPPQSGVNVPPDSALMFDVEVLDVF